MTQLFLIFILLLCSFTSVKAVTVNKDSLIRIAETTRDEAQRGATYRNLVDIYLDKPEEIHYLKLMYQSARKAKNKALALDALRELANSHILNGSIDSARYYMDLIKKEPELKNKNKYLSVLRIRLFEYGMDHGKKNADEVLTSELDFFKTADKNDIYIQIEMAYVSGVSHLEFSRYKEADSHFEQAWKLSKELTDPDDAQYQIITGWIYANNLKGVGSMEKSIKMLEDMLELYKNRYEKYYMGKRPYYNIERSYLQCYSSLMIHAALLPKEKLQHYIAQIKELGTHVTDPFDRYNYLLAMNNYYLLIEDYPSALKIVDEQIKELRAFSPKLIPYKFMLQSDIYNELGDYRNALLKYKTYIQYRDSFASKEREEQLITLQVEYEVNKLKFEKLNLESKNKLILVIMLSVILLLAIVLCIYLYSSLKKEKQMKKKLFHLNEKAGESERMKTEFINSMCHEIRTPLNAIVGFSDIILQEDYDSESKAEFGELIKLNTELLTSLVNDMLVVSNLDSSSEILSCEVVNISDICREVFGAVKNRKKPIEYVLNLPEEEILFSTHASHLSLVLENLLKNAIKFTQEGCITLELLKDKDTGGIRIQITDTGCGIPIDKQEVIFERFTKLDSFVQGNGLGLFLSKLIITRLMGTIRVDASYTGGARFIISLPVL